MKKSHPGPIRARKKRYCTVFSEFPGFWVHRNFLTFLKSQYIAPVWQKEPDLHNHSPSPPLLSGKVFSPKVAVGGLTYSGPAAGRRSTGTCTADPGEPGADSGPPDFSAQAGLAGAAGFAAGIVRAGTGGWPGSGFPDRSSSTSEFSSTRKNRNVPLGV